MSRRYGLAGFAASALLCASAALVDAIPREPGRSEEGKALKNPIERSDGSVQAGKRVWLQHCATCHGTDGKGHTEMLEFLKTPPPDFTKGDFKYGPTDGEIFTVVRDGTNFDMPPFADKLSDNNMWLTVNFMRSITPEVVEEPETAPAPEMKNPIELSEASIATGKRIWLQHCATCHGTDGKGQTEMLEFLKTPPPDFTKGDFKYGDTDGAVFNVIQDGTEFDMTPFKDKLNANNTWHVINFMRSLILKEDEAEAPAAP